MTTVTAPALLDLARGFAQKLHAVPSPKPPARATFTGGHIAIGEREIAVLFDKVGCLFVSLAGDQVVVEACAFNSSGEPRDVVKARHDQLEKHSRMLFADDNLECHDPLGLRGGEKAVSS